MVYIRIKRIKNHDYAYLVKNTWINKKPKQSIVKYLGNVSRLRIEDIPEEYLTDQIRTFLQQFNQKTNDHEIDDINIVIFKNKGKNKKENKQGHEPKKYNTRRE